MVKIKQTYDLKKIKIIKNDILTQFCNSNKLKKYLNDINYENLITKFLNL